ncbi:hypothetical protein CR194_18095 [Salipaludibacillus keqinensis]|uniref:Uncharacterized protein n=1 Tax=Salipaludibacillus keqinensis TaxID=2045207 RepID=A0A323T8B0_9BACI|nr:hypothetical protein CR194_18095 [Salipaludibacillus keqinensis]
MARNFYKKQSVKNLISLMKLGFYFVEMKALHRIKEELPLIELQFVHIEANLSHIGRQFVRITTFDKFLTS